MARFQYPRITLVIALVLGELAERSYHQSISMGSGDWTIFFTRPTSLILFLLTLGCLWLPAVQFLRQRKRVPEPSA
jgi:putative tricarboxylic transport membrane protein